MFRKPRTLYKYREWGNSLHQDIIRNRELYLANPKSFEDKYDCHIPLDFESLTDKQIRKRYLVYSKKINPTFTLKQHKAFSDTWFKKGRLRDITECRKNESEYFERFDKQVGVLSLTLNSTNHKMWEEYADEHKGFCIGFDFKQIRKEPNLVDSYGYVRYKKVLPSISPLVHQNPIKEVRTWYTQIFTKLKEWEFEKEYRIFKIGYKKELSIFDRKINVPAYCFKEIILGANIEPHIKAEIIDIVKKKFSHISVFQASLNDKNIIRKEIYKSQHD